MTKNQTKIGQHNLIKASLRIFEKSLLKGFESAIKGVLNDLFHQAEVATSNQMELELFEQYNVLRKEQANIVSTLHSIILKMPDELYEYIKVADDLAQLSLVEDEELEITLALTQLESLLSAKFLAYLFALEKRLKVLFSMRNVTKTNMPFGATSICWVLSQTLDKTNLELKNKTQLLLKLNKELVLNFETAYKQIDEQFVKAKILPNIKLKSKVARNEKTSSSKKTSDLKELKSPEEYDKDVKALQNALTGQPKLTAEQQQKQHYQAKSSDLVESIFKVMNQGQSGQAKQQQHTSDIDNEMMDKSLNNLSKITNVAAGVAEMDKLKEMILDEVRNETGIYYPSLTQRQQNSLDVMGMFYEHVKNDVSLDSNMMSSLNAINIPLVRTAIKDEEFFNKETHPARQYLEKIIYASQKWHGTSVVKNLHKFSSNVATEFDGTTQSFESANDDVESYLRLTERRAKNAEEKWVNAAKGKEKLESSRQVVRDVVDNFADTATPEFVKRVMKYVVQDALTLTLLRNGEDSEEWHQQVAHYSSLSKMANKDTINELGPKEKIESLHHLDKTMDELGFSDNDRQKTINNFKECAEAAKDGTLEETIDLAEVVSIKKDEQIAKKPQPSKKIEEIRELNHEERMELTKFKMLPYGTLFDFILNQQRDKTRRKLSWFSPLSNKALFVSLLGNKPHERTLDSIAIDIYRKNIFVVKLEDKKYFNNALNSIFNKIKGLIGKK